MMPFSEFSSRGWEWFRARAHGRHAALWLAALSFAESSFFLIPPDVLLVAILLAGAERWVWYAGLTTIASVLGGLAGYVIGAFFFDAIGAQIIAFYRLTEEMGVVQMFFNDNAFLAIFTAAFTPIPYKVFVLAAGFFKIDLAAFFLASVLGRGLRFFAVAFIVKRFGEAVLARALKSLNVATALLLLAFAVFLILSFS